MYSIRLKFVTAPTFIDPAYLAGMVTACNNVLKANSAPFEFLFTAATDYSKIDDAIYTVSDQGPLPLDPNGFRITKGENARSRAAQGYPNKIVIFAFQGVGGTSGGHSWFEMQNHVYYYLNVNDPFNGQVGALLHEIGHYMHLFHTFNNLVLDLTPEEAKGLTYQKYLTQLKNKAANYIRDFVDKQNHPKQNGLAVFDGDNLFDTPPDPCNAIINFSNAVAAGLGNNLAENLQNDINAGKITSCGGVSSVPIPVTFKDGTTETLTLQPDKTNIMSYYQACDNLKTVSPGQQTRMVDMMVAGNRNRLLHMAGVRWPNGKIYFFKGPRYLRFDEAAKAADAGYPKFIAGNWVGWPAGWDGVDAAFIWPGSKEATFFRRNLCIKYNIAMNTFINSPAPVATQFSGWPASWTSVDAALVFSRIVYFFRGAEYIVYSFIDGKIIDGPKIISAKFDFYWQSDFDCMISHLNGDVDVFKGHQYITYNLSAGKRVTDTPVPVRGNWPGITNTFTSAIAWTDGKFNFCKNSGFVPFDTILHDTAGNVQPLSKWHLPASWPLFDSGLIWKTGLDKDNNPVPLKAYFFNKDEYVQYDVPGGTTDPGYPKKIKSLWPNWPLAVNPKVTATLLWPNGTAFLFVVNGIQSQYLIWNTKTNTLDPTPHTIGTFFKGWPGTFEWQLFIKAVLANWWEGEKGIIYFFSANEYIKYDVAAATVLPGYPKPIEGGKWKGLDWWKHGELI